MVSILLIDFEDKNRIESEFHFEILLMILAIFTLFFPVIIKFWSFFGFKFKKPNWNGNPFSLDYSNGFTFFQFVAYWFICSGFLNFLFILIFSQHFDSENIYLFFSGICILIGMNLSLRFQNIGKN